MKKLFYCALVVGAVLLSAAAGSYQSGGNQRYHQHRQAQPDVCNCGQNLCTHLPVLLLETGGAEIPGEPILDGTKAVTGYTLAADGQTTILASLQVLDGEGNQHLTDAPALTSAIRLRKRGNSSRMFDKSSYALELVKESGKSNPQPLLGMAAHEEWALYGPFLDKTLLRNYMLMNISGEIMENTPNVRFCEVVLNGQYQGLYVLMETVARGPQRVDIARYKPGERGFGYIVKMDRDQGAPKSLNPFSYQTFITEYKTTLTVEYPKRKDLTSAVTAAIEDDISKFERALFSYDFKDPTRGYQQYIDVDSFVDYYILQEFLCVNDMCSRSTYLYKDGKGKLTMGPVWDYNNALNNFIALDFDGREIYFVDRAWYKMLMRDEYFVDKVVKRYRQLRKTSLNEEYLLQYMDETIAYLGDAVQRNYEVWGYSFNPAAVSSFQRLRPLERNPATLQQALEDMKDFIHVRGQYLDENIETLYQYCHASRNKQYIKE